jgi:hypothetical protein
LFDLRRGFGGELGDDVGGDGVTGVKIGRIRTRAHPAEGAEAVVETQRSHDVFDVGRVAEAVAVWRHHLGAGAARFEQEGVAVVPKVHAALTHGVDGRDLATE